MSLPPFAPVPPSGVRSSLSTDEWNACLNAWLSLTQLYLRLPLNRFKDALGQSGSFISFLKSYHHEVASSHADDTTLRSSPEADSLLRSTFRLVHRIGIQSGMPNVLLGWEFLSDICRVHARNPTLPALLDALWSACRPNIEILLQKRRESLTKALESFPASKVEAELQQMVPLMHASPNAAVVFLTGSDFLDALVSACSRARSIAQRKLLVSIVFFGLRSLVQVKPANLSLLADHLYSLKSYADQNSSTPSILVDLVTNTPIATMLRQQLNDKAALRLTTIIEAIETYQRPSQKYPHTYGRRKMRDRPSENHHVSSDAHVHQMSLVTQIQDLFPDLGSGFVLELLKEYDNNVEVVTAHLLDDSIPPHLHALDRTEKISNPAHEKVTKSDILLPESTPPPPNQAFIPERRNIFDNDELDRLDIDPGRLHIGKKESHVSETQPNKAAILSALATFDSDDDERDDTYDLDDVGGMVETAHPDGEPAAIGKAAQEEKDAMLYTAYRSNPELFGRTHDIRRGQARHELKKETRMTDEAIEGWAIMLQRDASRLKRLEDQHGAFDGKQTVLLPTSYRESPGETETEGDSDVPKGVGGRDGFKGRGRGRGRGGRGRGGSVTGPSGDANTAAAQRNKEAHKGSRANHNRRNQRAKKMARAGFPG